MPHTRRSGWNASLALFIAFQIVPLTGEAQNLSPAAAPDRQIKLEQQDNFRDLGGYKTDDGRTVRWGQVYRSGQLTRLSDPDVSKLKELKIRTVIDLRSMDEVERTGKDQLPEGARGINFPIDITSVLREDKPKSTAFADSDDFMLKATRSMVVNRTGTFSALIHELADPESRPLVFHCTAGKDRTGVGAAILLTLLGVPWETVRSDYLLSNDYRKALNDKGLQALREELAKRKSVSPDQVDMKNYEGTFLVKPDYIDAAHDEIIQRYGSMEAYIRNGLGIPDDLVKKLREALLQ